MRCDHSQPACLHDAPSMLKESHEEGERNHEHQHTKLTLQCAPGLIVRRAKGHLVQEAIFHGKVALYRTNKHRLV